MKPTKEQYSEALQALIERRATLHVPAQDTDADLVVRRYVCGLEDEVKRLRAALAVAGGDHKMMQGLRDLGMVRR